MSAMKDEGHASWSYERDSRAKPELNQMQSQFNFADREAMVSYVTKKLRLLEGKRVGTEPQH